MFRIAAGEYDELHEGATLANPEMTLVIGFGSGGQDRNSQALMHLTSLMDDATSERWIRRLEVPGTVEWQRFDVPAPRGRFHDCASAHIEFDPPRPTGRNHLQEFSCHIEFPTREPCRTQCWHLFRPCCLPPSVAVATETVRRQTRAPARPHPTGR